MKKLINFIDMIGATIIQLNVFRRIQNIEHILSVITLYIERQEMINKQNMTQRTQKKDELHTQISIDLPKISNNGKDTIN